MSPYRLRVLDARVNSTLYCRIEDHLTGELVFSGLTTKRKLPGVIEWFLKIAPPRV